MNIGLEGIMLCAAGWCYRERDDAECIFRVSVCTFSWNGIGTFDGIFCYHLKTDMVLTGIAMNLLASGGTVFVLYAVANDKGMSTSLKSLTMPVINIPFIQDIL
ncbi:MAG: hypothetical protein ACLTCI_10870 [[Clostridium] nexile]